MASGDVHLVALGAFNTGLFELRYSLTNANWDTLEDLDGATLSAPFRVTLALAADGSQVTTASPVGVPFTIKRCIWKLNGFEWRDNDLAPIYTMIDYSAGMLDPGSEIPDGAHTITCEVTYVDDTVSQDGDARITESVTASFTSSGFTSAATVLAATVTSAGTVPDVHPVQSGTVTPAVVAAVGTVGAASVSTATSDARPDETATGYSGELTSTYGTTTINQTWLNTNNGGSLLLEDVHFTGQVTVAVNNLTIRNFLVSGGLYGIYNNVFTGSPSTGLVLEDGEVTETASSGLALSNATIRRLHIHHHERDGCKFWRNVTLENSYIHHLGSDAGSHADGVQMVSGENVTIRGNNFDMPHDEPGYNNSQCLIISANTGTVDGIMIDANWINGGGFSVNISDKGNGYGFPTNVEITDNRMGRDYQFGPFSFGGGSPDVVSGNVWDDTGEPI